MMDDDSKLLDDVRSDIDSENRPSDEAATSTFDNTTVVTIKVEELDAAIDSVCDISETADISSTNRTALQFNGGRRRMTRRRSAIWYHFKPKQGKAKCLYCNNVLSTKGGSSGNLMRHLRKKHGVEELTHNVIPGVTSSPTGLPTSRVSTPNSSRSRSPFADLPSGSADELEDSSLDPAVTQLAKESNRRCTVLYVGGSHSTNTATSASRERSESNMRRKRSVIWYHFNAKEGGKAECRYCENVLSIKGGASGNLLRHLKKKHVTVEIVPKTMVKDTSPIEASTPSASQFQSHSPVDDSILGSADELEEGVVVSYSTPPKIGFAPISTNSFSLQPSVSHSILPTLPVEMVKPVPIGKSAEINNQLLKMIVKEYYPFNIVENAEFQKFVHLLCPGHPLPSGKTLKEGMMPALYRKTVDKVKSLLNKCFAVTLTTDTWTSINNTSFLAVTAHFLDGGTKMKSYLLDCIEFTIPYAAVDISNKLNEMCQEWNIQDKVSVVVTHNSIKMVAAMQEINFKHLPCFAHTINLIVQHSTERINSILNKCINVVQLFKQSSHALPKLNKIQEQMDVPVEKLKQSVSTRWNSSFQMLERILANKEPLISTLALLEVEEKLQISTKEWRLIEQSVEMLRVFYEISVELCAGKNVSLSKTFLLKNMMKRRVELFLTNDDLEPEICDMGEELLIQISGTLEDEDSSELIAQATLLDPRFKKYGFGGDESAFNEAYNSLLQKLGTVSTSDDDKSSLTSTPTQNPCTSSHTSLWEEFDDEVNQLSRAKDPKDAGLAEMDKFLLEPLLERTGDPHQWWEYRRRIYPRLYSLVLSILCIPATSVPCERIFSKAGNSAIEKRNRLSPKNLSMVVFLNHNLS